MSRRKNIAPNMCKPAYHDDSSSDIGFVVPRGIESEHLCHPILQIGEIGDQRIAYTVNFIQSRHTITQTSSSVHAGLQIHENYLVHR